MEVRVMRIALITLVSLMLGGWHAAWSAEQDDAALIKAVSSAKVTLQKGLTASQREGRPISAKFEMENGKLQLSVYTEKNGKFFEVIVDHMKGSIAKTEPITEGDDLADAKSQSAAMANAKTNLQAAVGKTVGLNVAVGVTPDIKDGHPVATISVAKGGKLQTVTQRLD
jgi:lipopolysaccharide export LptBFGC system permease protein LptF